MSEMEKMKEKIARLAAYEVISHEYLPDVDSDSWLLRHKKTGARVALLPKADSNKVFYIAFRTPPEDSTGVAHIIEHTVLCGSRDFPVKDPFIELAKGSLNTFLNAMTYPDKTVYPVASCNLQDFKNLMHVYLDAVFYPNIYREQNIFRQEGWHYEAEDADGEITVNGVVYNEMKGALSSPDDILGRQIGAALYPHTPYVHESGGDPVFIPDLTYEDYLEFHRRYYHPSNSYIYLYGDMDMAERLAWIDEAYLSGFDRLDIDSAIPAEPAFAAPVEVSCAYSILPEEDPRGKSFLSWNVAAFPDSLDAGENMALKVLNYALCDAEGAPVRKALRDRGLGEDVYSMFETGIRQPSYSIVAKYADPERKDEFVSAIRGEMERLADEGIDPRALEAGINYYEFRYREADFGSFPKGLIYGLNALESWLYDDEKPFINLHIGDYFDEMRKAAKEGFFEKMIRRVFLDNPHCAVVVLKPEQGLSDRLDEEMRGRMKAFAARCSKEEREKIVEDLAALRAWQQKPDDEEDILKIPMLKREDLERKAVLPLNEIYDLEAGKTAAKGQGGGSCAGLPQPDSNAEGKNPASVTAAPKKIAGAAASEESAGTAAPEESSGNEALKTGRPMPVRFTAVTHPQSTSRIDYLTFLFDVRQLPEEYIRHLCIFKTLFGVLDTASRGYAALGHEINICTGGINAVVSGYNWYGSEKDASRAPARGYRMTFEVSVKTLHKNLDAALSLLSEILTTTNYNMPDRILEVLEEERAGMRAGMASAGHATAAQRALSYISEPAALMDLVSGISAYQKIDEACEKFSNPAYARELCSTLKEMAETIFRPENLLLDCTATKEDIPEILSAVREMALALNSEQAEAEQADVEKADAEQAETEKSAAEQADTEKSAAEQADTEPAEAADKEKTAAEQADTENSYTEKAETEQGKNSAPLLFIPLLSKKNEGLTTAGQVQYVCRAGCYGGSGRESTGAFRVLRVLLGYEYLWNRVRVEGGAYGCMSNFTRDGYAFLVSYRDPHLKRTIRTFEETADFLRGFDADERTMTKYIIGAVSALDQPMTPYIFGRYSLSAYLTGVDGSSFQKERDQVLDADVGSIRALADCLDAVMADGCLCVVGSDAKIRENGELFGEIRKLV